MQVTVVYSPNAREVLEQTLELHDNATVADALHASGWLSKLGTDAGIGVWGRKADLIRVLREHDRVEIYRPLQVDPKLARKERFGRQGARSAGLFSKRRPGSKPGY